MNYWVPLVYVDAANFGWGVSTFLSGVICDGLAWVLMAFN